MGRLFVYTSPARGHLFPLLPTLLEMQRRGHQIQLSTLASEVQRMRDLGLEAQPIAAAVENRDMDDWKGRHPLRALSLALKTFADRAPGEVGDVRTAEADLLLVDVNSWGAQAAAEASGKPWAVFSPYLLPFRAPGVPAWGLGLAPRDDALGRFRDGLLWALCRYLYDRFRPQLNALRAELSLPEVTHTQDTLMRPPLLLYYTAEPFEYSRPWPPHVRLVGPGLWEPQGEESIALPMDERPLVLVTCSTEYQNDGKLIATALEALAAEPVRVVATTAAIDPASFTVPANASVARFLPHGPLLERASAVICHAGMGITQKALAAGVPVCAVPFGRDQMETARHVQVAGAGSRLPASHLSAKRLRQAVKETLERGPGAARVAEGFRAAGGAAAAADALESLLAPKGS